MAEAIAAGLLVSLLTGGSLKRLQGERLVGEWALLVLLPIQSLWPRISEWLGWECAVSIIVWLVMMASLAVVLMINAPRRWMLAFAALGIAANVLVIGANGAMPVSIKAASETGGTRLAARTAMAGDCLHEEMDDGTQLSFLADVIAIPGPSWQRGVISLGDVLLALGLGSWVFAASRQPQIRNQSSEDSIQ